jgi:7-cyano-7-deazaguanine reductase
MVEVTKMRESERNMETVPNLYMGRDYDIHITCPEFTCLCPKTSQPDFAEILITYTPEEALVELKSLKLYLYGFRDKGIFHEEAVNRILDDFVSAVRPKRVEIVGKFNVRGGIYTTVRCCYDAAQKA